VAYSGSWKGRHKRVGLKKYRILMKAFIYQTILPGLSSLLLTLGACQHDATSPSQSNAPVTRPLTAPEAQTVGSANDFAFRAFSALRTAEAHKNIFISPLSLSAALTMTYNGADGATKTAMQETLGYHGQTDEAINQAYKSLAALLNGIDKTVTFNPANSLWHARQYPLQAPFTEKNKTYFNATVQGLDFSAPASLQTINDWVKTNTQGKIDKIVEQIRPDHVLFLINAIYFKGTWTYPFDKKLTRKAPFHLEDGSTTEVDLMTMTGGKYLYYQDAAKQVIDLPYGNRQFSMTLVVPQGSNTVSTLASGLTQDQLSTWLSAADTAKLDLHLPRFKLEYKKELRETLTQMGMGHAFSNQADFSRMIEGAAGGLAISEVTHKTFVAVDEEGTEAAAATSVGIVRTSLPPSVLVDRPFIFLIREKSSNAILFIGQLMQP
jgi:serine protease inhibitor